MRFEKTEDLLQLAFALQASAEGLSLTDIEQLFGVGRRTAQRMRDAAMRVFPQIEEVASHSRIKRWRMRPAINSDLVNFNADELASLDAAIEQFDTANMGLQSSALSSLRDKVRSLLRNSALSRIEPDLEALIEAEGLAMRPGPRPRINLQHLAQLREAVMACKVVALHYSGRDGKPAGVKRIAPYGFLYGHRHYLVGAATEPGKTKLYMFRLSGIEQIEITEQGFERDPAFSLQDYAARSFGLWQEDIADVALRFSPRAAHNARDFLFHPSQTIESLPDGGIRVHFHAGGLMEMAWHLYCWGDEVEVLQPAALAEMVHPARRHWEGLP